MSCLCTYLSLTRSSTKHAASIRYLITYVLKLNTMHRSRNKNTTSSPFPIPGTLLPYIETGSPRHEEASRCIEKNVKDLSYPIL